MQSSSPAGQRREVLLSGAVAYAVEHGIASLSLRPLAAALGTSDRMLIYYFGTRDALLRAVLEVIAGRLRDLLVEVLPTEPQPPADTLAAALTALDNQDALPLLALWLEVIGRAARGDATFRSTAQEVTNGWVDWLATRLAVAPDQARAAATALLVIMDGLVMLAAVGTPDDVRAAARWLVPALH